METLQRTANRGSVSTGFDITNSVKLEDSNNEWFYRASPTAGNRRTFTFSFWIKRTELGAINASGNAYVLGQGQHGRMYFGNDYFQFRFDDGHDVRDITTKHRDPSAWLHVVVAVDTNQSSSSDRVKIYFNGVQTTTIDHDGGSYPDIQDQSSGWFTTNYLTLGTAPFGGSYNVGDGDYDMSAYLAQFCAIDGSQLAPTSFGEFDSSGIWKPIDVSGLTFGSQGYFLDFADASDLGDDESGNGNDFTENNIAAADQSTDTPTNNFCVWSPLWVYATNRTISEGGTKLTGASAWGGCKGSIGVTNGKWYWENKASGNDTIVGWQTANEAYTISGNAHNLVSTIAFYEGGNYIWIKDSTSGRNDTSCSGTYAGSQTVGFALDLDSSPQTATFYRNGSAIASDVNIDGLANKTIFPFISQYNQNTESNFGGYTSVTISSGNTDANGYGNFEYAPPSGYYAICTKNLAEFG